MLSDEEIALAYWHGCIGGYGDNKAKELAGRRAIESAATAPLLAEIERLTRELEEARKDAERYLYLRNANMDERNRIEHYASSALDAAIDAAIKEQT